MSSLPGGPAYTQLNIGDTGLPGVVYFVNQSGTAGLVAYRGGNFPSSDIIGGNPTPLDTGHFQFAGAFFDVGDAITFDIAEGEFGPYATNVQV